MKPPLWLPVGSVRAILALALTAAVIVLAMLGRLDPAKIFDLATVALGFYFITRSSTPAPPTAP